VARRPLPLPLQDPCKTEPLSDSDEGEWPDGYSDAFDGIPLEEYEMKLKAKIKTEPASSSSARPGPSSRGIPYLGQNGDLLRTPLPIKKERTKRKSKPLTMRTVKVKRIRRAPSEIPYPDPDSLTFEEHYSNSGTKLWNYFLRDMSGKFGKCKTCDAVVRTYGGTTALWRHVNKKCSMFTVVKNEEEVCARGRETLRLGEEYMEDNDSFLGTCPTGGPIIQEFDTEPDPVYPQEDQVPNGDEDDPLFI